MEGYIGKIRVRQVDNSESFLNVFKKYLGGGYENYSVRNDNNNLIGEIYLTIKKFTDYDRYNFPEDPSHVYVSELRNYSNPTTPFYKEGLEWYKDIGVRLMQIAQRRSDEALCKGNIKLISKNESKSRYKNFIGMTEEFSNLDGYKFNIYNPNAMILPPQAKEHLLKLNGGL